MRMWTLTVAAFLTAAMGLSAACGNVPWDGGPGPTGPAGPQDLPGPLGDVGTQGIGNGTEVVRGSGVATTRTVDVSGFERIDLGGEGRVVVARSDRFSLSITTDDNLLEYLEASVTAGTLHLRTRSAGVYDIEPTNSVLWEIEAPDVTTVTLSGAGDVTVGGVTARHLDLRLTGAGSMTASGVAGSVDLSVAGAGSIDTTALEAASAVVSVTGVGSIALTATDAVVVENSGIGSIEVHGSPRISGDLDRVTVQDVEL